MSKKSMTTLLIVLLVVAAAVAIYFLTKPAPVAPPAATEVPATDAPATDVPATDVPATDAPATDAPATDAPAAETPASEAPKVEGVTYLGLTTGGTGGTYYPLGGEIAALWMKHIPNLDVSVQSSGGSKDNILKMNNNEADLGTVQNDVMYYAYQGDKDFFNGEVIDSFVAIGSLYPELVQVVVAADSDIKTIADLKDKNVSVGAVGSGVYFNAVQLLGEAGLTLENIKPQYLSFAESADSFQNRQLDAFFVTAGLPNPSIMDVASKREVRLIGLEEAQMKTLQEKYSFYVPVVVPAGSYNGMKEDVTVPAMNAVLIVSKDVPEDLVYEMTKVLFENTAEMTHAKKEFITGEFAVQGIPVPFHPGAEKYFKEKGLLP